MSKSLKQELTITLQELVETLCQVKQTEPPEADKYAFGPTKSSEHGDLATNAALLLAKPLGRPPLDIADSLAKDLAAHPYIDRAETARPGFVNIWLSNVALAHILKAICDEGVNYGDSSLGRDQSILLEFVSANPTGPMHIGHCRHAAVGDALARILRSGGYEVTAEFYLNDAGEQVTKLGRSFRDRCFQALGKEIDYDPENYPGEYLIEFAEEFTKDKSLQDIEETSLEEFKEWGKKRCLEGIRHDLNKLGVFFQSWVMESTLYERGAVKKVLEEIRSRGASYEKEGAEWLRTQDYGDDRDRVLIKSDGSPTYILPDLAYHVTKYERGFDRLINLFGSDHAGYPPRLRAGIAAAGYDPEKLTVRLLRLIFLRKEGERVRFSKRAGNFVAMGDIVDEIGPDATRFFMIWRSIDTEFDLDLEVALEKEDASINPLLKIHYAHARTCSLKRRAHEEGFSEAENLSAAAGRLTDQIERDLMMYLSQYPEIVERCAQELAVHHIPNYLLGLAELWNRYWTAGNRDASLRVIQTDDKELTAARLVLCHGVQQVLYNGLTLLGISAPERMVREEEQMEEAEG